MPREDEYGGRVHRRRGRPRQFDGTVSVRLPQWLHDELTAVARRTRLEMSDVIRRCLMNEFRISNIDRPHKAS